MGTAKARESDRRERQIMHSHIRPNAASASKSGTRTFVSTMLFAIPIETKGEQAPQSILSSVLIQGPRSLLWRSREGLVEFDNEMQSLIRDYERRHLELRLSSGRPFVALYARGSDMYDQPPKDSRHFMKLSNVFLVEKSKWGPSPASPEEALMNRPHASC